MAPILDREPFSQPTRRRSELLSWIAAALIATPLAFLIVGGVFAARENIASGETRAASASASAHLAAAQRGDLTTYDPAAQHLAAAATRSFLDRAAVAVYQTLCPLFGNCNIEGNPSTDHATSFSDVKSPYSSPGARDDAPAAPTTLAASSVSASRSPIARNAAMPAAASYSETILQNVKPAESIPSNESSARSPSAPATSYTSPDLAHAAHQVPYVAPPQGQVLGASTDDTAAKLADLQNQIDALKNLPRSVFVPSFSGPAASTPVNTQTFAASQKIDQLSSTVTVGGSPIATAATVSDSLSNYLPLSGGTLTGTLALSGAISAPYFTATSTTATSTFAGGLTAANNAFAVLQNGNVGIGKTAPIAPLDVKSSGQSTISGIRLENQNDTNIAAALYETSAGVGALDLRTNNGGFTGTQTVRLKAGGVSYMNGGAIGFGTTNPGALLHIASTTPGMNLFQVTGGSNNVVIDKNGNVGIGTTNPQTKLVVSNGGANGIEFDPANGYFSSYDRNASAWTALSFRGSQFNVNINNSVNRLIANATGVSVGAGITPLNMFDVGGGVAVGSYAGANAAPSNGMIVSGNVGIGTTTPQTTLSVYPAQGAGVDITTGADSSHPEIKFADANGNPQYGTINAYDLLIHNGASNYMYIANSGNVGIGTTSPAGKLDVYGNVVTGQYLDVGRSNVTNGNVRLWSTSNSTAGALSNVGSGEINLSSQGGGSFLTFSTSGAERVRMTSTGNVGIGTTNPLWKLTAGNSIGSNISTSNFSIVGKTGIAVGDGSGSGQTIYLYSNGGVAKLDAYNYDTSSGMNFSIGGNGGDVLFPGSGIWKNAGNVGIGTTSPNRALQVQGGFSIGSSPTAPGIAMITDSGAADIIGTNNANTASNPLQFFTGGIQTMYIGVGSPGNVGIGTTNPASFKLQVAGNVGPETTTAYNLGSTALRWGCVWTSDGSTGTCASDSRLKDNIADVAWTGDPLAELAGLRPRTFTFKDDPSHTQTYGLIAQEAEQVAPELVVTDASTTLKKVKYGAIQWLVFSGVQKLIAKVSDLSDTVASLAERVVTKELVAVNLTANKATFDTLCVKKSDGTPACITGDQLSALLSQSAAAGFANPTPAPTDPQFANPSPGPSPTEPPIIEIQGKNPAHLNVGDSYNDLGARITGPTQADTNLGIHLFLDGAAVPSITLGTQEPGEHTIDYVATNAVGTSTSTRTVIIDAPEPPPSAL